MSSPKDSDYQIAGDNKVIKKSIIPIIRIVVKNSAGEKELKGTLSIFIRKNRNKIINNATVLYKQKVGQDTTAGYVNSALPYKELEKLCKTFCGNS